MWDGIDKQGPQRESQKKLLKRLEFIPESKLRPIGGFYKGKNRNSFEF